jgi:uncharacterized phage-like protein YoqJ
MLIAATGHRPNKLGGYGPKVYRDLVRLAEAYIDLAKPSGIISGMALGWDQAWADAGINKGVPVHAAVPFVGQESRWPKESQDNFNRILKQCASVTIVCEGVYSAQKMQTRNEWMVDKADRVCALWDGTSGGTGNCVRYVKAIDKPLDNLWEALKNPTRFSNQNALHTLCSEVTFAAHLNQKGTCNMSIEALIQAHTEALLANTEAVKLLTLSLAGRTPTAEKPAKKERTYMENQENLTAAKESVKEDPKAEEAKAKEEKSEAVPYETVRALVLKLAPTQRDAIKALNAKHGIANLKVLLDKEDDFSTVNDQAKLEAVYADLQALEG